MAHEWDRGVLNASSWHGLETIGTFTDADSLIAHGRASGALPIGLQFEKVRTESGLFLPDVQAIVAHYQAHPSRGVGLNGNRYRFTTPEEYAGLARAAVAADAKPTGVFSLSNGSKIVSTFEIGVSNGLRTHLMLADSFDGSLRTTCGASSIRVVCANTLQAAFQADGEGFAQIRHTSSAEQKINVLRENIGVAIRQGQKIREVFEAASRVQLPPQVAAEAFNALFPQAPEDAKQTLRTRLENAREEARKAAKLEINRVGTAGNLATLWNAATWLVDRTPEGAARECRGGADRLESLLFGSRAARVAEIQEKIETILEVVAADGTTIETVREAIAPATTATSAIDWVLGE